LTRVAPRRLRPRTGARLTLLVALTAAGLAGCGNTDGTTTASIQGVGGVRVGSVSQLAQCRDWLAGDEAERLATIDDIRNQINTGDAGVQNATLSDEQAYSVFDGACRHEFAAGFRLYKLYFRAAAFEPVLGPEGG
jgi:hypothetical protein